jgi:hypothetical protein
MVGKRYVQYGFLLVALVTAPVIVMGLIASDIVNMGRHTIGEVADGNGYTWYARDDRTLFRTDLVNAQVIYSAADGLRRKEFHIFNPVFADSAASATQAAIWRQFFGS